MIITYGLQHIFYKIFYFEFTNLNINHLLNFSIYEPRVAAGSCTQIPEGNSYLMAMCTGFGFLSVGSECELEHLELQVHKCFFTRKFLFWVIMLFALKIIFLLWGLCVLQPD